MASKAKLNNDQKEAFKAIQKFIDYPAADTFVLKGYAGTGKTFLMQYLAQWLDEKEHKFSLLASTGRAAAVLRGKTGLTTKTVHGELYHFNKVDGADEEFPEDAPIDQHGQITLFFSLRQPDAAKRVYIVDESSMLSSEIPTDTSTVVFGSGNLLDDFFSATGSNKVIFVGDPGQLPPVKQTFSPALELDWLSKNSRNAISVTLEKIERTSSDNDILVLASMVRNMALDEHQPKYPKLPAINLNNTTLHLTPKALLKSYINCFKEFGPDHTIAIARSNRKVDDINREVRKELHGEEKIHLEVNEVLLVTNNNYAVPLTNGDFITVSNIGETAIQAGLHFQKVTIKTLLSDTEYDILLSLEILYGEESNFTKQQQKTLMVDFNRRMKKKNIMPNSEDYKDKMMSDPFLNCLRARYGYAVTCHKAQGGEWNDVYLFLDKGMYAMSHQELYRWWYTAITRTRKQLHLENNWWVR